MKKALFIYPHNFLMQNMGTNVRVYNIAAYLKEKGFQIDLFALKNFCSPSFPENVGEDGDQLVTHFYLYDFKKTQKYLRSKKYINVLKKITANFGCACTADPQDWVDPGMKTMFGGILKNAYDYIVMFYIYTGNLLNERKIKAKKIYFMEDFLSVTHYLDGSNKNIGSSIESEIRTCKYFDKIAFISFDEKNFFEKILPSSVKCYFIPHIMKSRRQDSTAARTLDVLFLGHDNPYNIDGMNWFFSNVYPHIDAHITIHVGGSVREYIPDGYPNVKKLGFVENVEDLYRQAKVSICPLLNGTGMKIKVVEAMKFGVPVVCTLRGIDGLPDKTCNGCRVTDDPREFAAYINTLCADEQFRLRCASDVAAYADRCLGYDKTTKTLNQIFDIQE